MLLLFIMSAFGLVILCIAANAHVDMVLRQGVRLVFATMIMLMLGFIPPHKYKIWTPWLYGTGLSLLIAVMLIGKIGKGTRSYKI